MPYTALLREAPTVLLNITICGVASTTALPSMVEPHTVTHTIIIMITITVTVMVTATGAVDMDTVTITTCEPVREWRGSS